jgi:hypothetical protein
MIDDSKPLPRKLLPKFLNPDGSKPSFEEFQDRLNEWLEQLEYQAFLEDQKLEGK